MNRVTVVEGKNLGCDRQGDERLSVSLEQKGVALGTDALGGDPVQGFGMG
jgi:hypothetical protein